MSQLFESQTGVRDEAGTSVRFWTNTHQLDQHHHHHDTNGANFSGAFSDFITIKTETDAEMRSETGAQEAQDFFNNCNNFTFISPGASCNDSLSNTNVTYFMSESDSYFKLNYLRSCKHSETVIASATDDKTFSASDDSIDQSTEFSVTDLEPKPNQHQHNIVFEETTQSESSRFMLGGSSTNLPAYICELVENENDVHRHNPQSQDNFFFRNNLTKSNSTPAIKQVSRKRRQTIITREVTSSEQPNSTPMLTVVIPKPEPVPEPERVFRFRTYHHHHANNKRKSGSKERTRRQEQAVRLVSLKDLVPWLKGVPREKCSQITILNGAAAYCQQLEATDMALMDQIQKEATRLHQNQQKLDVLKSCLLKVDK